MVEALHQYYGDFLPDLLMRIAAILLSVLGTATRAIEDAYDWRAQASIRRRCLTRMRLLFDNYCVLSGEYFDPEQAGSPARRGRATPCSNGVLTTTSRRSPPRLTDSMGSRSERDSFAGGLDLHHSGANFRRYLVTFSALEDECSANLAKLHDRSLRYSDV